MSARKPYDLLSNHVQMQGSPLRTTAGWIPYLVEDAVSGFFGHWENRRRPRLWRASSMTLHPLPAPRNDKADDAT